MKEKIGKISRGIIEYELPRIILSKEKLVLSAEMWRRQTGRIGITNSSGVSMKGIVCSDNRIFEITTPQFVGVNNTVEYVIRGDYITGCEDISGEITFVTDCGEVSLPYRISVSAPSLISSEGTIADMSRFVSLARYHWEEALRLFNDPAFLPFLQYHEPHSVFLLEVLRKSQVSDRALEEFLVVTGKKMGVTLQSDEERLDYSVSESRLYGKIQITKSTWGYVNARVTSTADFLVPDREQITMESFHENRCDIPFRILPDKLGYGTSTATLAVEAQNQQLFVTICNFIQKFIQCIVLFNLTGDLSQKILYLRSVRIPYTGSTLRCLMNQIHMNGSVCALCMFIDEIRHRFRIWSKNFLKFLNWNVRCLYINVKQTAAVRTGKGIERKDIFIGIYPR